MRIKINFTKNTSPVPVQKYDHLNSYINKCLGNNNPYHDKSGPYNVSSIQGGILNEDNSTLEFENGAFLIISSLDMTFLDTLLAGITQNTNLGYGMEFSGVDFVQEQISDGWNHFFTLSPMLFKDNSKQWPDKYVTFKNNPDFVEYVKMRILKKLSKINPELDLSNLQIQIRIHEKDKVKHFKVHGEINHANQFQISFRGNKDAIRLLYHIGVGQSTNSGFGTIAKVENYQFYRPSRKIELKKSESLEETVV
jgi:CRISPR-associated endoribonuclease Cas6